MSNSRPRLTEEQRETFGSLIGLYWVSQHKIHSSLLEDDNQHLEKYLHLLEDKHFIETDSEQNYTLSERGEEFYQKLIDEQESFLIHFDIYSYVDLEEGVFGGDDDFLDDNRWADLRVAVAEHKGIDPYRIVFLSLLSNGYFFEEASWKFDLAMGSLLDELEEMVLDQYGVEDLGYESEDGEKISGDDVIRDVIEQGSEITKEYHEQYKAQKRAEQEKQNRAQEEDDDELEITTSYVWSHGYW